MTGPDRSAPRRPLCDDDLYRLRLPSDPRLSPDGRWVAYSVTRAERDGDHYRSEIWLSPADGGHGSPLTRGAQDWSPRWSPDGSNLAFLRAADGEPAQIWLMSAGGGEGRQISFREEGAGAPVWSPDGTSVAFAAVVGDGDGGPDGEHPPHDVYRLDYKADGAGLLGGRRRQIFVLSLSDGVARQVTWGDMFVSSPVYSPDGTRIAYAADRGPRRDLDPASAVYVVDLASDRTRQVTDPAAVFHPVAWTGEELLVVGRLDRGLALDHIWSLHLGSDEPRLRDLVPQLDRDVTVGAPGYPGGAPTVSDGRVHFCVTDGGAVHILAVPLAGGAAETVVGGAVVVDGFSCAAGRLAHTTSTPTSAGELYVDGRRATHFFDELADVGIVPPSPRTWVVSDGREVHGWVLGAGNGSPKPLLLDIHGGPHNSFAPTLDVIRVYHQYLAARGWIVVLVNSRGSDGYGEEFMRAVSGGWGTADQDDFLGVVDDLVSTGEADPERMVVSGYSYGGFMTCWLTTQTDRFRAAVAGGVVTDMVSMFGSSDDGSYIGRVEWGGSLVDARDQFVKHSPLTHVNGVTTPTLLLHGEEDQRCPVSQAEHWFAALRHQQVPTVLVRYPAGGHLFVLGPRPSHRLDYARRLVDWAERWTSDRAVHREVRPLRRRLSGYASRLASLAHQHQVPGAVVGVLCDGETHVVSHGVANLRTGAAVRPDTLFQIGSNQKLYTATLVMRLVEQGRLGLETRVADRLPELRLADADVMEQLTVFHLLTHTSGLTGDHFGPFTDFGDDAIQRFVASLCDVPQLHPVGELQSYCNSGWSLLGRLVEVVTGQPYADALRDLVTDPMGIATPLVRPNDILLHDVAVGHTTSSGRLDVTSTYQLLPSHAAAGSTPAAKVGDVLAFLQMHLGGGTTSSGAQMLRPETVDRMQQLQAPAVLPLRGVEGYGLGWRVGHLDGLRWLGHGGGTLGGISTLEVLPDQGVGVVVLTNAAGGGPLGDTVVDDLFGELVGVTVPPGPGVVAGSHPVVPDRYVGTYVHGTGRIVVSSTGALTLELREPQLVPELDSEPTTGVLAPTDSPDVFLWSGQAVTFTGRAPDGRPAYVYVERLFKRTEVVR